MASSYQTVPVAVQQCYTVTHKLQAIYLMSQAEARVFIPASELPLWIQENKDADDIIALFLVYDGTCVGVDKLGIYTSGPSQKRIQQCLSHASYDESMGSVGDNIWGRILQACPRDEVPQDGELRRPCPVWPYHYSANEWAAGFNRAVANPRYLMHTDLQTMETGILHIVKVKQEQLVQRKRQEPESQRCRKLADDVETLIKQHNAFTIEYEDYKRRSTVDEKQASKDSITTVKSE